MSDQRNPRKKKKNETGSIRLIDYTSSEDSDAEGDDTRQSTSHISKNANHKRKQTAPSKHRPVPRNIPDPLSLPSTSRDTHHSQPSRLLQNQTQPSRRSVPRRRSRAKPGTRVLQEIRRLQKSTKLLIPKLSFMRVVRDVCREISSVPHLFQGQALLALQEAAELYLVQLFCDARYCSAHARRKTIMVRDMQLTRLLRGRTL